MKPLAKMRRCGSWLLGLFLITQLAIVMPSIGAHATHSFDTTPAASHRHAVATALEASGASQGLTDGDDSCTLHHHLGGVLTPSPCVASIDFVGTLLGAPPPRALPRADRVMIDKPPKPVR